MDEDRDARTQPLEYLLVLRRRIWWAVVPMAVVIALGTLVTFLLPVKYQSAVTIAITGGSLSSDLTHPIDREERARAFTQHLFEPSMLSKVAQLEHLTATTAQADVPGLRNRIQVTLPTPLPGTDPAQVDTYVVSYSDSTAERARRVAQRLADVFVDETSKIRQVRLEDSSEFLSSQVRDVRAQLDRIDAQLTNAKARNMGRLPEQTTANVQMVQTLRQQLDSANTQLQGEQDRLNSVNRTIALLEQEPTSTSGAALPSTAQQRVRQLEQKLAADRLRYTDKYPDVKEDEEQLARAKKEAAAEQSLPLADRQAALSDNPAYRQALEERKATELRMRDLARQIEQYNLRVRSYEGRLEGAPVVEQQIDALQQDRAALMKHYDDLSYRLQNAKLQEDSERRSGSEHFRVLYPANLPSSPSEPNRQRLLLLTVGAALFVGVGSAVGREYLDQSIHDARALQRVFDVPVLGEIPHIDKAA